jgi:hypothetical protein
MSSSIFKNSRIANDTFPTEIAASPAAGSVSACRIEVGLL